MSRQPESKATQLVERLNRMLRAEQRDELEVVRIRRDSQELRNHEPAIAYVLQGMLATLDRDHKDMRRCFEAAGRLTPGSAAILYNYAVSLNNLAFFSEAREKAYHAYQLNSTNLTYLDYAIETAFRSGRFDVATDLLEQREGLNPTTAHPTQDTLEHLLEFVRAEQVDLGELEQFIRLVTGIMQNGHVPEFRGTLELMEDENSRWIAGMFYVAEDTETVVTMNIHLADALGASDLSADIRTNASFCYRELSRDARDAG